uniref:FYVE-type domain-containing protein n=1 Tax=Panagrellus redivivus TaxID=6233 RepID=A0A7E4VG00_PANRE
MKGCKRCINCRRELGENDGLQCDKCKKNEEKYGKPEICKYCRLPAAFVDRKCVHCAYSERKMGAPVACIKCYRKCAFVKEKNLASTAVCRNCVKSLDEAEKARLKRAAKVATTSSPPKKARHSSGSSSVKPSSSRHSASTSAIESDHLAQVQQLRDQISELKTTITERDHQLHEKDKVIGTLRTDLMARDKEHRQAMQTQQQRNEQIVNQLKEQVKELTKQLSQSQRIKTR